MKLPFRRPVPPQHKPTWVINIIGPDNARWATYEIGPDDYELTYGRVVVDAQVIVYPDPVIRQVHEDT